MANEAKQLARDYLDAVDDVEIANDNLLQAKIRARDLEIELQGYWKGDVVIPLDNKTALLIQKIQGNIYVNKVGIINEDESVCCKSI